jgi:hypothetical protein
MTKFQQLCSDFLSLELEAFWGTICPFTGRNAQVTAEELAAVKAAIKWYNPSCPEELFLLVEANPAAYGLLGAKLFDFTLNGVNINRHGRQLIMFLWCPDTERWVKPIVSWNSWGETHGTIDWTKFKAHEALSRPARVW